ncbi:MAG: tetraacyldisaccharide 4'-kinase, partial [Gammaproteobacteria bacterium]|nr:tetraacyldisaccharide 4'-kinase [Gammaproteobacteria bacterium]
MNEIEIVIFFSNIQESRMTRLENYWYKKNPLPNLLLPFSWLFCALVYLRRKAYATGLFKTHKVIVPVIVVGNITVGGSGKTPLVIWMVEFLKSVGYYPGIVSRGYKGHAKHWPQQVRPDSDPEM